MMTCRSSLERTVRRATIDFALILVAVFLLFFLAMQIWPPAYGQTPPREPYSCRLYYDEQRKCAFGSCDQRTLERLKRECLRDGGRP
jgi:hypothetical protein